jgi:hypothetical protein
MPTCKPMHGNPVSTKFKRFLTAQVRIVDSA